MKSAFKLLLVVQLLLLPAITFAQVQCLDLFGQQSSFRERLKASGAPVFDTQYAGKTVSSVLVNSQTYKALAPTLKNTIGIVVAHQKGYRNDHGSVRIGDFFVDRDLPGYRNRGEINNTGIAWGTVKDYLDYAYKKAGTYVRVEALFELSNAEYNTALIYQKMRRAALVRPDFTFGGGNNPKEVNNRLDRGGEICFSFSCGSSTPEHVREIAQKLSQLGITDLSAYMSRPSIKDYIQQMKEQILEADLIDGLFPEMTLTGALKTELEKAFPELTDQQRNTVTNWVVGLSISKDYENLINSLQIHNSSSFSNITSKRSSTILVYDANVSDKDFLTSDYMSEGIFSTWKHKN